MKIISWNTPKQNLIENAYQIYYGAISGKVPYITNLTKSF